MKELENYNKEIGETPKEKANELMLLLKDYKYALVVYDNVFDELIPYSIEMIWWIEVRNELEIINIENNKVNNILKYNSAIK